VRLVFSFLFLIVGVGAAASDNIVVIGDSHTCSQFGQALLRRLSDEGKLVTVYCATSSAPQHWLEGRRPGREKCKTMSSANPEPNFCFATGEMPALASILSDNKGAKFVLAMGTNSLMSPTVDNSYADLATAVLSNGNACAWIGPPHLNPAQSRGFKKGRLARLEKNLGSFYRSLAKTIDQRCTLLDSRQATAPGKTGYQTVDGVHRTPSAGKHWAKLLLPAFSGEADREMLLPIKDQPRRIVLWDHGF